MDTQASNVWRSAMDTQAPLYQKRSQLWENMVGLITLLYSINMFH